MLFYFYLWQKEKHEFYLFHSHALMKATTKDYVRNNQIRLILVPVSERIENTTFFVSKTLEELQNNQEIATGC